MAYSGTAVPLVTVHLLSLNGREIHGGSSVSCGGEKTKNIAVGDNGSKKSEGTWCGCHGGEDVLKT